MHTPAVLLSLVAFLIVTLAPFGVFAQGDPTGGSGNTAAAAQNADEDLYGPDDDDDDIEVIKVRGGEAEGAADFESGDSVAAFDASDLEALGAQSIADLASFTPNLEIVTSGATTPTFFIRGVGLNDFNANSSGAVAIYFNDVPKNSPALQLGTLFDIEGVNVLRGPQGMGNYRSASAGAIKIYTKKPTGQYNAYLRQSYGNYNSVDLEGAVGAPIYEDILAGRLAFRFSDRDGYGKNGCGGAPPASKRGVRPGDELTNATDPQWSVCGEGVPFEGERLPDNPNVALDGRSQIPAGLPERTNNQHNWAARGTLLFQPTLDQEWLLTASGGKRDELSRQGQSYGTFAQIGPLIGSFGGGAPRGLLGGQDGMGYIPEEVEIRRLELDPCRIDGNRFVDYTDAQFEKRCLLADGVTDDVQKGLYSDVVARSLLAKELAEDLDRDPHHGDYNAPGPTELEVWGVSIKGDMVLADSLSVTTVTGYDHYDRLVDQDLDQSPNVAFQVRTKDDGWQFAQTIDVTGDVAEDVPVRWTTGMLFLYEELNVGVSNTFGGIASVTGVSDRAYKQKLWSGAAHAGFTFTFWEKFAIDAGVRYNWERKSMNYVLTRADVADFELFARKTWQAPSGGIRLTYNFNEFTYAYWKYTRGWKGGHFNATGGDDGVTNASPENIDSFEMGLHASWFTGVLTIDISFFHYNYRDYQLFTAQQRFDGLPEFVVINASDAEVYGSELDIAIRPRAIGPWEWTGLTLQANIGWLESQFLDYTQIQVERRELGFGNVIVVNNEIQNSGNQLLNSPRFKVSLTAEQKIEIGRLGSLTARWDGAWTDDTNYDATESRGVPNFEGDQFLPDRTIGQKAFWIHNARLAYTSPGGVEIAAWVRNLTDEAYKNFAFDVSTFNNTTIYFVGEPRTYGMSLMTTF